MVVCIFLVGYNLTNVIVTINSNPHLLKQTIWPTSNNPGALHAFCEKLGKTIFLPACFLSYHLLSEEVGLLVLMQYSRKAMFKELFPWAVQLFITHHSSLSTPGTAGTALANEKSPCLTCRGCQPTPLGLSAEGGLVPRAGVCQPCCVCPLSTPTLTGGQQPSPAASRNAQSCSPNGPELTSARHRTQGAREVAFLLHTRKGLLLGSKLLERKELLEVEGTGGKDSSFQLVSSSVSPDQ